MRKKQFKLKDIISLVDWAFSVWIFYMKIEDRCLWDQDPVEECQFAKIDEFGDRHCNGCEGWYGSGHTVDIFAGKAEDVPVRLLDCQVKSLWAEKHKLYGEDFHPVIGIELKMGDEP